MQKLCSKCIRPCKQGNLTSVGRLKSCTGYYPINTNHFNEWFVVCCVIFLCIACTIFWVFEKGILQ